jgi:hypothetical protein
MASNETQIVISARDEASNVLRGINQQFDAMRAPISSLQGAVAGLGAAFAGLSVVTSIKGALTMADEIGKLAQKTGVAVESFSKLSYAAKLSDVSNEQLATGLKKLSQNMTEAAAGTGQVQKYFQALGVSVTDGAGKLKSADTVMGELAGKFAGMEDGAAKTAAAMAIFGKSGADLIPLLNAGSGGLASMADEAQRLGLVMSTDMAKGAETFNDNLTKLTAASQGLSITLGNEMLPGLIGITNAMVEAVKEGSALKAIWVGLGGLGAVLFTDEFTSSSKKIEKLNGEIKGFQENLKGLDKAGSGIGFVDRYLWGDKGDLEAKIAAAKSKIDGFTKEIDAAAVAGEQAQKARAEAAKKSAEDYFKAIKKLQDEAEKNAKPKAASTLESDYSKLNKQLSEQIALADASLKSTTKLTEGEKLQAKVMDDIVHGRVKLTAAQKQNIDSSLKELVAKQNLNLANEAARKLAKESIDAKEKETAEAFKHAAAINDEAIQQEDANAVYGLGKSALEELTIAKLEAKLASIDYATASFDEIDALEKEIAARKRLATAMRSGEIKDANAKAAQDATREWQKASDEINRSLTDALLRGFESGKGFAQNFVDTVKNMFNTMVLKPIISAIVSPVSGMIAGGLGAMGVPGYAGAAGTAANGAGAVSSLGGLFPGAAGAGLLANGASMAINAGFTNFGAGLSFAANEGIFSGFSAGLAGLTESTVPLAASFGAMLPVIGLAVGALAMFGAFDSKGGPKTEGDYFGTIGPDGNLTQRTGPTGTRTSGTPDFYTAGSADAQMASLAPSIADSITGLVKSLGGDATGIGINFGYNTDPEGNAPDNISTAISDKDGNYLYQSAKDVERGQAEAAMQAELPKMLLASLKAADLSPFADKYLDSIADIGSMTEEEVQRTLDNISIMASAGAETTNTMLDSFMSGAQTVRDAWDAAGGTGVASIANLTEQLTALDTTTEAGRDAAVALTEAGVAAIQFGRDAAAAMGITAGSLANAFLSSAQSASSAEEAGEMLAQGVVDGIYNSLLGSYAQQIGQIINDGIVGPMITALLAGQTVSEAVSQASIDAVVAKAQVAADAMNAVFNDARFIDAMKQIEASIQSVVSTAYAPIYDNAEVAQRAAQKAAEDAARAAEDAARQQQQWIEDTTRAINDRYQTELNALDEVKRSLEDMLSVSQSLADYVKSLKTSDLSPLTMGEKLAAAGAEYTTLLAQAKAGDVGAAGNLQGASQEYLDLARQYYASSSQYTAIFDSVTSSLEKLSIDYGASYEDQMLALNQKIADLQQKNIDEIAALNRVNTAGFASVTSTTIGSWDGFAYQLDVGFDANNVLLGKLTDATTGGFTQLIDINGDGLLNVADILGGGFSSMNMANATGFMMVATAIDNSSLDQTSIDMLLLKMLSGMDVASVKSSLDALSVSDYGGLMSLIKTYVTTVIPIGTNYTEQDVTDTIYYAQLYGISSKELADSIGTLYGITQDDLIQWAITHGMPAFATGGYYTGGMALVGEQGPELINFSQPGKIYNAADTRSMLGSQNGQDGLTKADLERLIIAVNQASELIARASESSRQEVKSQTSELVEATENLGRTIAGAVEAGALR